MNETFRKVVRVEVSFEDGSSAVIEGEAADKAMERTTLTGSWVITPAPKETTTPVNSWGDDT